jgi:hypothetical protein
MIVTPEQFGFDRDKQREIEKLATDKTLTEEQRDLVSELGTDRPFFSEVQSYCFYCGEKLTVPAVMWHGNDGKHSGDPLEICLHAKCAENLSARIERDVNELKLGKKAADEQLAAWKRDHPI